MIAMVIPSQKSEKAISSYAMEITKNIKQKVDIENVFYEAGSVKSFFKIIPRLNHDVIHLFHEYNLLGNFGLPFFLIYQEPCYYLQLPLEGHFCNPLFLHLSFL